MPKSEEKRREYFATDSENENPEMWSAIDADDFEDAAEKFCDNLYDYAEWYSGEKTIFVRHGDEVKKFNCEIEFSPNFIIDEI